MFSKFIDQLTGRKVIPNARVLLRELGEERQNLVETLPAKIKLAGVNARWERLDRWFDELGYSKEPKPARR
jgi:predicted nuclease with RNAse H fold